MTSDRNNRDINSIAWIITEPAETACFLDSRGIDELPLPDRVVGFDLAPAAGDRIALFGNESRLTVPFQGTTVGDFMTSIERGMRLPATDRCVDERIEMFGDVYIEDLRWRQSTGRLVYADLVGDHYFFEGRLRRADGVWTYAAGS